MIDERDHSDVQLKLRTAELLAVAERVAAELELQNDRLLDAMEEFQRDVLVPMREGRQPYGSSN